MFSKIKNYFAEKPTDKQVKEIESPKDKPSDMVIGEIGWDNSNLYSKGDFQKYDPDTLRHNKGYDVYEKMMKDDQIKAALKFKIYSVLSRSYHFDISTKIDEETGKEIEDEEQKRMADFFEVVIDQIKGSWIENLELILSAFKYGYSFCEKNFGPIEFEDKSYWGIKDIKLRPYETFDGGVTIDEHGNITKIKQMQGAQELEIPINKIIHFVHQKDIDAHYGESDLKAAYRHWWAKDIAIKLHNLYLERLAGGFIDASYTGKLSEGAKTDLKNLVNNISGKMGALHPDTVKLTLFPAVKTDAYQLAIAMCDKGISKSILVPNLLGLSEQGNVGSYSQSDTQKDMFFFIINAIAKQLDEVLNEQLFRQLALWNFGTEKFPRYTSDEFSEEQREMIAKSWAELVNKNAVTKSDSDETHIRNLMHFPDKTEDEEEDEKMPETINPDQPGAEGPPPESPQGKPTGEQSPDNNAAGFPKPKNGGKVGGDAPLPPTANKFVERKNPWMDRVNFFELKKSLDQKENLFGRRMADIMGQIKDSLFKQIQTIVGQRSLGNVKFGEFKALNIPKKLSMAAKTCMKGNLQEIVDYSIEEAKKELPKKMAEKLIAPGMDTTQIARFLKEKSDFFITGVLEPDVLQQVLQLLQNGILYDKSLRQMMVDLEKNSKLLTVLPATDSAGRAVNVPARLENIVRTNTSGALNMGRSNLFARDEYKGFIEAYQYSAILDDRTTDICETLDGRIRKDWGAYAPPNHFQCRSILVPVTVLDEWDGKESTIPSSAAPQEGFD